MEKSQCGSDPQKKNDKQCIKNYRPVSLLLICSKIFERLLFNKLYKVLNENDLLSSNQSEFWPGDPCENQLLSITNEIYQSFNNDPEVRGVFLDISKAFDKFWPEWLILKLSRNSISGNLLYLLKDFLKYRKQRVVLNGQNSFGKESLQVFHKDLFWDLFCSWFILMTGQMACRKIANCLQMTRPFSLLFMMSR